MKRECKPLRNLNVDSINEVLYTKDSKNQINDNSYVIIDLKKNKHMIDPIEFVGNMPQIKNSITMKFSDFRKFVVRLVQELAIYDEDASALLNDEPEADSKGRTGPLSS